MRRIEKEKSLAPRNRTIILSEDERVQYRKRLLTVHEPSHLSAVLDNTICQDAFEVLDYLPANSIDLLFADPPYNLSKTFNEQRFQRTSLEEYEAWLDSWLLKTLPLLKREASIYICGDWRSSAAIHRVGAKYFIAQNRITWEREKGRGAKGNWKNR